MRRTRQRTGIHWLGCAEEIVISGALHLAAFAIAAFAIAIARAFHRRVRVEWGQQGGYQTPFRPPRPQNLQDSSHTRSR